MAETTAKLSATQVFYLRTIHQYTEGDGDPNTSWVVTGWQRTEASLTKRGLIEPNPSNGKGRDRQSVRLTDAGRAAMAAYEGREIEHRVRTGMRHVYKAIWKQS